MVQKVYPGISCAHNKYKFSDQDDVFDCLLFYYFSYPLIIIDEHYITKALEFVLSSNMTHMCLCCNNDIYTEISEHINGIMEDGSSVYICIGCFIKQNTKDDVDNFFSNISPTLICEDNNINNKGLIFLD